MSLQTAAPLGPVAGPGGLTAGLASDLATHALANPVNAEILLRLHWLRVPQCWLVAGAVYQSVWNARAGRPAPSGVKDYDVFYYDASDLSYAAEDAVIQRADTLFADLDAVVEVRNQARVHLWYEARFGRPYAPSASTRDAIGRFLVACTCVGVRPREATPGVITSPHQLEVAAPHGLADLFSGRLVANPRVENPARFREKVASYRARWPWLEVCDAD